MIRRIVTVRKLDVPKDNEYITASYVCDIAMTDQEVKEFQAILMAEHFVEEKSDD